MLNLYLTIEKLEPVATQLGGTRRVNHVPARRGVPKLVESGDHIAGGRSDHFYDCPDIPCRIGVSPTTLEPGRPACRRFWDAARSLADWACTQATGTPLRQAEPRPASNGAF